MPNSELKPPNFEPSAIGHRQSAFFLIGPTATGKTAVAHLLAERLNRSVISADSMMVYRHMNIGTAKPTAAEIAHFHYTGLDLCNPDSDFSVGDYLRSISGERTRPRVQNDEPSRRSVPSRIVCGGTGLYIRCLTEGLREFPPADAALTARAEQLFAEGGVAALQAELQKLAPEKLAALADPKNPRRLIRALETIGTKVSKDWKTSPDAQPMLVGLCMEKSALEKRIRARVAAMYSNGLVPEADALRRNFPALSKTASQAIGYAEAFAVLDNKLREHDAKEHTAIRTRQLAKKQMTWFRRQHRVAWVDVGENDSPETIADKVDSLWNEHGPTPLHH